MSDGDKASNPKDVLGVKKISLHLVPGTMTAMASLAFLNGAMRYGRANWRAVGVSASVYIAACKRHLEQWFEGEECDPDDGVPHLGAALACIGIIIDARAAGKLTDDRNVQGGYRELVAELTPIVAKLQELHKDRHPRHYTIQDREFAKEQK